MIRHTLLALSFVVASMPAQRQDTIWMHARYGRIDALRKMLDADPKLLDRKDGDERTPLHLAARWGRLDIVKLLLARGAAPDEKAYNRFTPLHMAIMFGRREILELLLEQKVDVNAKTAFDRTPVDLAIEHKQKPLMELLLKHGAHYGIYSAACRGDAERIRKLLKEKPETITREMALQAIRRGHAEAAALLAPLVVDRPAINMEIREPLLFDATAHLDVVKALIASGQDPAERNESRFSSRTTPSSTLLHVAARNGHTETLAFLLGLDDFEDRDLRNAAQQTPAHEAAKNGRLAALQLLHASGADLEAKDRGGRTAVHHAASSGHPKLLAWMTTKGIVLHAPDKAGRTPLALATKGIHPTEKRVKQRLEAAWTLVRHGVKVDLRSAAVIGDTIGAKTLLEQDPELVKEKGLLVRALSFGNKDIVALLLDAGADVQELDERKTTPLHWCASWNQPEIAKLLLARGADVHAQNRFGYTPLHEAARAHCTSVAKVLLDAGAKRDVKDKEGKVPLALCNDYTPKELRALLTAPK